MSNITTIRWDGYSIFNGVTFRGEQRLSNGLAFTAFYTLSQAIDDASDPGGTTYEANLPQDVRNQGAGFLITGQVPGDQAVHTATDVPLSAFGLGASSFGGVIDNTDVFFKIGQIAVGGVR